ncbi:MAG: TIGR03435 family protein [Acidobacteriia bacterium]|nr:TIGR03435 family protein [Terriglobia bacterium]
MAAFVPLAAFSQAPPEFEVASIKPSVPPGAERVNVGMRIDGAQVHCTYFALKDYIAMAYGVPDYQVSGPDWMASQRFDITAKLPEGGGRAQIPEMMATLLAERFQLKIHRETKDFPVYAIVVGKGELKLKESAAVSDPAAGRGNISLAASGGRGGVAVNLGNGSSFAVGDNRFEATRLTMASFAESIRRFLDRPVLDMTGLTKAYDFTLTFSPEDYNAMLIRSALSAGVVLPPQALKALDYGSGDSLIAAVETLGLKLDRRKAPLDLVVVDHMEKSPTEN